MRSFLFSLLGASILLFSPFGALAISVDVGFTGGTQDIFFSKEKLIVGESVRIYARVHNLGDVDVTAQVVFYHGDKLIGEPQIVSARAKGLSDEVYVDWTIPDGAFNIRAEVKAQYPRDENPANDTALTALLTAEKPAPPPPPPLPVSSGLSQQSSSGIGPGITATSVGGRGMGQKNKETKSLVGTEEAKPLSVALAPPLSPSIGGAKGKVESATIERGEIPLTPPIEVPGSDLLKVALDVRELDWNTFRLSADVNRVDGVVYEWSFGDGKIARGKEVTHSYTFAGRYIASVVALHDNGERAQAKAVLDISFWHLGNWQLILVLLVLGGVALLLLLTTRKEKKEEKKGLDDRPSAEEGTIPPILLTQDLPLPVKKKRPSRPRKKKESAPLPPDLPPMNP